MLSSENVVPSSPQPADDDIFSDEPQRASSPPSSPPGFPWEQRKASGELPRASKDGTRTAFTVLGKRKALTSLDLNARPSKRNASLSSPAPSKPLTQMQISLGQEVQKRCKQCGMEYVASSNEDRKLHDKYHKQNTEGLEVGKDFVQKARDMTVFKSKVSAVDSVCAIDCFDKQARKRRGQAALEIVQRELGAVAIPEKDIWDVKGSNALPNCEPTYRAYMYIRGSKCVGYLLTQKITQAHRVRKPNISTPAEPAAFQKGSALSTLKARKQAAEDAAQQAAKQLIELSDGVSPAILGICRIWTSPTHRNQNIAMSLLDAAVQHHMQRIEQSETRRAELEAQPGYRPLAPDVQRVVDEHTAPLSRLGGKDDVAFSQPTEAGARLARRWFGKLYGWKVYVD